MDNSMVRTAPELNQLLYQFINAMAPAWSDGQLECGRGCPEATNSAKYCGVSMQQFVIRGHPWKTSGNLQ